MDRSNQSIDANKESARRIHAFDALRAGSILLVVTLHACVPYVKHRMPGLLWPTFNGNSELLDPLFWWIECFIMALYFVTAGFFAAQILQHKGTLGFIKNRFKRLFVPLVVSSIVILPITGFIWTLGWVLAGRYPVNKLKSFRFEDKVEDDFFGFSHLWFLQYLVLFCILLIGAWWLIQIIQKTSIKLSIKQHSFHWLWAVVFGIPLCAWVLHQDSRIVLGFQQESLPVMNRMIYYLAFFLAGIMFYQYRSWLALTKRFYGLLLVSSLMLFTWIFPSVIDHLQNETSQITWWLSIMIPVFAWLSIFASLGFAFKYFDHEMSMVRYLADSSYWMYLIHLPVLGIFHLILKDFVILTEVKLILSLCLAIIFCLFSYHYGVRHTIIGAWLDGKQVRIDKQNQNNAEETLSQERLPESMATTAN